MKLNTTKKLLPLLPKILGTVSLLLGIIVLIGWYTHNETLIQVNPHFVPMQYNTALGFALSGLAILLWPFKRLSGLFSFAVLGIGLITLCEYIFKTDLGLDQLFMEHYIGVKTSHPGRMAPNTALCFSLSGLAFLLFSFSLQLSILLQP